MVEECNVYCDCIYIMYQYNLDMKNQSSHPFREYEMIHGWHAFIPTHLFPYSLFGLGFFWRAH
jgi:hypothetical protein